MLPIELKRKDLTKMGMKISDETAHIWAKEAVFQEGRTSEFLQMCVEMDGISAEDTIRAHPTKVKRLLLKDREDSRLELFPLETLMDTSKI